MIFDLRTEYAVKPLYIDVCRPRFSWKLRGGDASFQSDYHITVYESASQKPVWDSGRVASEESVGIEYGGEPLKSFTRYTVKVRVNGGADECEDFFETAALEISDFQGEWIGMPYISSGQTLLIRRDIPLLEGKSVARARAYVAGLGFHRAYLNGTPISEELFNPQISVYDKRVYYTVYPLSLTEGLNTFGVELGNGWYPMRTLWALLLVEYTDGTVDKIYTQHGWDWKCRNGAVTEHSIYGGESYDARQYVDDWCSPTAITDDGSGWGFTCRTLVLQGKLRAQSVQGVRVVKTYAPVNKIVQEDGSVVCDFGQNICGRVRLILQGRRGASVRVQFSERIDQKRKLLRGNLRAAKAEDCYILRGGKKESYAPEFTYHGFQYAQIFVCGKVEILDVRAELLSSGVDSAGTFTCSDEQLNRLHQMAVLTEQNNLNGIFTDCPQRDERFGWLNDMTSRIYQSVCNFDCSRLLPSFVAAITDEQKEDGSIPDTVPYVIGGSRADAVAAYILLGYVAYMRYGDKRVLEENYEGYKGWFSYLSNNLVDGTLTWGMYGDWVPAVIYSIGGNSPFSAYVTPAFVSGAYYVWYAEIMQKIASALGKTSDVSYYEKVRAEAKQAFYNKYYDREKNLFGKGSQTECAVSAIVCKGEEILSRLVETIQRDVEERGYHTTCGNQGYRHVFYLLGEYGLNDTLIKLLKNPEYPGWGYMLSKGATTIWERWEDSETSNMHSFNHPMLASFDGYFYEYLGGIRASECTDAFGNILFELPNTELLSYASATMNTVRGEVKTAWEKTDFGKKITIVTPPNTRLTVRAKNIVKVNGERVTACDSVSLPNGTFTIECEV